MNILFIGDIVGSFGRQLLKKHLPSLQQKYDVTFTIANGENATHGKGIIQHHFEEIVASGVDVVTLGNHYDAKSEIRNFIGQTVSLIRPLNLKNPFPGAGTAVFDCDGISIRVSNFLGKAFMEKNGEETILNPFDAMAQLLQKEPPTLLHIVDFHAEATGEKYAFAYAFDGKVTAVLGTHTHVQTRDARILPSGTAYLTDVGMTGPHEGILGVKKEAVIARMWKNEKTAFEPLEHGQGVLSGAVISVDEKSGRAKQILPIFITDSLK